MQNLSRFARPVSLVSVLLATACGFEKAPENDSSVKQLTDQGFTCVEYSQDQIDLKLEGMPANFMRDNTWTAKTLARARNVAES